jgi:L-amino acid N-acyltransferase YncA
MTLSDPNPSPSPPRLFKTALDGVDYRMATAEDAPAIAHVYDLFFHETGYPARGIVFSLERTTSWIEGTLRRGVFPHLLAICNGQIIGVFSYQLDDMFCVQPVAVLQVVYVLEAYRSQGIARMLIKLCVDLAKNDGACAFHAPIASEMIQESALVRIFAENGFGRIGLIVGRSL